MTSWHKKTVDEVVEKLGTRYLIEHPKNLPEETRSGALHQPDIVVLDKGSKNIVIHSRSPNS